MANNPKHRENLKPFKKGQSGNPKGRPLKLPDLDILMADVLGEEKGGKTAAQEILSALTRKASKGDIRAAEVLFNRGYGLPKQRTEVTGKDGEDLKFNFIVSLDLGGKPNNSESVPG